jgi:predicted TIM-barrel fold metal-dependent hydrolase
MLGPQAAAAAGRSITARELVALMDTAGIRRAVVLSVAYMYGNPNRPPVENEYERVKAENDWTSQQVARYPERLIVFCSVNPVKPYALEEIARCANDPQLRRGLKLHFGNSDVDVHNPQHVEQVRRVFRLANEKRMPIAVHMRGSVNRQRPHGRDEARIFLTEFVAAAPDIPVQIAHLSGAGGFDGPTDSAFTFFADAVAARDSRMARVIFDISGVIGARTPSDELELMAKRIRTLGVDRVVFGSDGSAPGNTPREAWANIRRLPLTQAELAAIASNTAPYLRP